MAIAYEDFVAWRNHSVTQEMLQNVAQVGADAAGEMMSRSSGNAERDQYLRGFVQGTAALIAWQPEFNTSGEGDRDDGKD